MSFITYYDKDVITLEYTEIVSTVDGDHGEGIHKFDIIGDKVKEWTFDRTVDEYIEEIKLTFAMNANPGQELHYDTEFFCPLEWRD